MKVQQGILHQMQQSNSFYYKKLTIKDVEEAMLRTAKSYKEKVRKWVVFTSELGMINMNIQIYNHPKKKRIIKLFTLLSRYRAIQKLYNLKRHHITVGYSKITTQQLNMKIKTCTTIEDNIITEIKLLYYGNSNRF